MLASLSSSSFATCCEIAWSPSGAGSGWIFFSRGCGCFFQSLYFSLPRAYTFSGSTAEYVFIYFSKVLGHAGGSEGVPPGVVLGGEAWTFLEVFEKPKPSDLI